MAVSEARESIFYSDPLQPQNTALNNQQSEWILISASAVSPRRRKIRCATTEAKTGRERSSHPQHKPTPTPSQPNPPKTLSYSEVVLELFSKPGPFENNLKQTEAWSGCVESTNKGSERR